MRADKDDMIHTNASAIAAAIDPTDAEAVHAASFANREHAVRCQGRHDARHPVKTFNRNALCDHCTMVDALAVSSVALADALLDGLLASAKRSV